MQVLQLPLNWLQFCVAPSTLHVHVLVERCHTSAAEDYLTRVLFEDLVGSVLQTYDHAEGCSWRVQAAVWASRLLILELDHFSAEEVGWRLRQVGLAAPRADLVPCARLAWWLACLFWRQAQVVDLRCVLSCEHGV